jgi:glycosyltransferase involved in cell wall biosynthesis
LAKGSGKKHPRRAGGAVSTDDTGVQGGNTLPDTSMSLSILIPCRIEPRILEMIMTTEEQFPGCEIIISNDRYGQGKGWALRQSLEQAKGDVIALIDGDMDIHPRMLWRLLPFICDYDVVVGRKENAGFISRRLLTFLSRLFIRALFGIKVDTQTGIKVFRRSAVGTWKTNGFMFDVEILANAKRQGKRMVEIPVDAIRSRKVRIASVWECFIESIRIALRQVGQTKQ